MRKRDLRLIQAAVLVALSLAYAGFRSLPAHRPEGTGIVRDESYYVDRAVDGDTLKLSNGARVRLIGIDTPEAHMSYKLENDAKRAGRDIASMQELGRKASRFTKSLCEGRRVRMEFDVTKRDKYGRLLAYVYLEDGTFVNAKIIEEGYAHIMTVPPNVKHADTFLKLEREARNSRRGLWGSADGLKDM